MFKKAFIGAAAIVIGFTLRDIRAGEEIYLGDSLIFFAIALAFGIFLEWTFIPYDWDKHKNKSKYKKNLS